MKSKILLIEDDAHLLKQLRWALERDYDVFTAATEDEAKILFSNTKPPVVTLDLGLHSEHPEVLSGMRLLDYFLCEAPSTRIIVVTGNSDRSNTLHAVGLGAFDYYSKPIRLDELKVMIQRAFHLYQFQQPLQRKHAFGQGFHVPGDLVFSLEKVRSDVNLKSAKKAMEADFLKKALDRNKGVVSRAARELGISRVNLYELINRYSIRMQEFKVHPSTKKQKMRTEGV